MRGHITIPPRAPVRAAVAPTQATLVVIEFSAAWPSWLTPEGSGDIAVVAQHYEGHPSSLVTQVAMRATRLGAVGWKMSRAVLVTNGRSDPESVASRQVLARGLLSRLRLQGFGELVLSVDPRQGRRAVSSLMALGSSLEASLGDGSVRLLVRAGDAEYGTSAPNAEGEVTEERHAG
jgi:hypothetical protein